MQEHKSHKNEIVVSYFCSSNSKWCVIQYLCWLVNHDQIRIFSLSDQSYSPTLTWLVNPLLIIHPKWALLACNIKITT
jgi:hypothetical protein